MSKDSEKIAVATDDEVAQYAGKKADETAEQPVAQKPSTPEDRIADLEKERDEFKDKMQRAQAECANISKRLHQQHADSLKLAGLGLARSILPVVDNLERMLDSLNDARGIESVVEGVRLITDQLSKALREHGVEPIEALGKPFDPLLHEALMHDQQSQQPPGTVTQQFEKGYMIHGRVLRHAKVAVAGETQKGGDRQDASSASQANDDEPSSV